MDTSDVIININGYSFKITENKLLYGGDRIISHTFKIGGDYNNCISVSYKYDMNNKPISAKIPHALYEPECAIGSKLERGSGTVLMLKTLLQYVHKQLPTITLFEFDDMSHIDCIPRHNKNMSKHSPPRPSLKPLSLSHLSIAYNSKTWYEDKFNATMIDPVKYKKYRETIRFLEQPDKKPDFIQFLQIAQPPTDQYDYLESIYNKSNTYREFFNNIPKSNRCTILLPWLVQFMDHYLKDVFSTNGWQIDVTKINTNIKGGSINTKRNTTQNTTRKQKLYPSNLKIITYKEYHNI